MNNHLIQNAILIVVGLGTGVSDLHAQSNADINAILADTNRLIAQSQRQMQEMRKSQGLPPLTGNSARDTMTMLREQQAAFNRHMEDVKSCTAGDRRACAEASRYEAAQRRAAGMMGALNAADRIGNSVTRHEYEKQWQDEYNRARANEYYYDKVSKNDDLKEYWKKQAEAYKPPYKK